MVIDKFRRNSTTHAWTLQILEPQNYLIFLFGWLGRFNSIYWILTITLNDHERLVKPHNCDFESMLITSSTFSKPRNFIKTKKKKVTWLNTTTKLRLHDNETESSSKPQSLVHEKNLAYNLSKLSVTNRSPNLQHTTTKPQLHGKKQISCLVMNQTFKHTTTNLQPCSYIHTDQQLCDFQSLSFITFKCVITELLQCYVMAWGWMDGLNRWEWWLERWFFNYQLL